MRSWASRARSARGSPPRMRGSAARSTNGASTRATKRHLSHSRHHADARRAGSWAKARLQLRNTGWYARGRRDSRATQSSLRSRRKLATTSPASTLRRVRAPRRQLGGPGLAPLVVHVRRRADAGWRADGGVLIAHRDAAAARGRRGKRAQQGDHRGHRNVAAKNLPRRRGPGSRALVARTMGSALTRALASIGVEAPADGLTTKSAWSSAGARPSTLTTESMPPPKGVRTRPSSRWARGRGAAAPPMTRRPRGPTHCGTRTRPDHRAGRRRGGARPWPHGRVGEVDPRAAPTLKYDRPATRYQSRATPSAGVAELGDVLDRHGLGKGLPSSS